MPRGLPAIVREVVSTWYGTFLLEGGIVVRSTEPPLDPTALADRARARHAGELTTEEQRLLAERGQEAWTTRDRRLADRGLRFAPEARPAPVPVVTPGRETLRTALLLEGERALTAAWDPSIHVEEAVRAAADLDRVRNLVGERLGSWVARDAPDLDPGDHARAARAALEERATNVLGPGDPALLGARRQLAELYGSIEIAHRALADAVAASVPRRTPNLNALLGPDLTARMLAQAGGLERLARFPASTIQVLGAEKAFFEHLRGRAPPPRHGHLFLHPAIQSAPKSERGKLARTLAGKVAIAARLDRGGAPIDPNLAKAFERRRTMLRARRGVGKPPASRRESGPPLHGASGDG